MLALSKLWVDSHSMADKPSENRPGRRRRVGELIIDDDGRVTSMKRRTVPQMSLDAATKPLNLVVGGVALAGHFLLGYPAIIAFVIYLLLTLASFFEARNKQVVPGTWSMRERLMQLPPKLRTRVSSVLDVVELVQRDLEDLEYEPTGLRDGLAQLTAALLETAHRAAEADESLNRFPIAKLRRQVVQARHERERDPAQEPIVKALEEQLEVVEGLIKRRHELDVQMSQLSANLGAIHARVVQAKVVADGPLVVDAELTELRDRTRALAMSFEEVGAIGQDQGLSSERIMDKQMDEA